MILYHGSNVAVEVPQLLAPNRYLDFGPGFYTTSNAQQAKSFAAKVTARRKEGQPTVSVYEPDEVCMQKLKVLGFHSAGEEWLDFVSDNRNGAEQRERFDLIYGPVADDDIFRTFILYSTGILTREQTLAALKVKKLFDQYVFASEEALKYLRFIKAERQE